MCCSLCCCFIFPGMISYSAHKKGMSDLYSIVTIGAVLGLHLMVMAINMLSVYLAIEMVSIASYLIGRYRTENAKSTEAGLKYVLFGAAASAVMLIWHLAAIRFTGSLDMFSNEMPTALASCKYLAVFIVAWPCIMVGIGFKLSFVPVHFYVPDVYQGAATPVTAYLSTLPKIAAFALLIKLCIGAFVALNRAYFNNWIGLISGWCLSIIGILP
jgi:NADH-quinone oxidoreductase subunit N